MSALKAVLFAVALACAACSGASPATTPAPVEAPPEANACGLSSGFAGDSACLAPTSDPATIQLRYGPSSYDDPAEVAAYTLAPGAETLTYQIVSPQHDALYVASYEVSERAGMHHFAFYNGKPGVPDAESALLNPAVFLTQIPHENTELSQGAPELAGAALKIAAGSFVVAAHAINTTDAPELAEVWIDLHTTPSTEHPLSALQFVGGAAMSVPPGAKQTIKASAVAGHAIDILQLVGHFHTHTSEERVTLDGDEVYQTRSWSEPDVEWFSAPTLHVPSGGTIAWECDVENDTAKPIRWSNALLTGEMCNVVGFVVGTESWSVKVN